MSYVEQWLLGTSGGLEGRLHGVGRDVGREQVDTLLDVGEGEHGSGATDFAACLAIDRAAGLAAETRDACSFTARPNPSSLHPVRKRIPGGDSIVQILLP